MEFEAAHPCKSRHFISPVDGIGGIGDIIQSGKQFQDTDYFVRELHIKQCIVFIVHTAGNIQAANTLQFSIYPELRQCLPADPQELLVFRCCRQIR